MTKVNSPIIHFKFPNNLAFTQIPKAIISEISVEQIHYENSNKEYGMLITDNSQTDIMMKIQITNLTILNCNLKNSKLFVQRAEIVQIKNLKFYNTQAETLFSLSKQQSHAKQLHILGMQLQSILCDECFYFTPNVVFKLNITSLQSSHNIVNNLNFTSTFLHSEIGTAYGSQITVENVEFNNLTVPYLTSLTQAFVFYLLQDGMYTLNNILVNFRPELDYGQFMFAEFQKTSQIMMNKVTIRNVDGSTSRLSKPVFSILGATAHVYSNNTWVGFMNHNAAEALVFLIKGSRILDTNSYYVGNRGTLGGVYHILQINSVVQIYNTTFIKNEAVLGGAINIQAGSIQLRNCQFHQNRAEEGGAISSFGIGMFNMRNCSFLRNEALTGSAISSLSNINLISYIYDTVFQENRAISQSTIDFTLTQVVIQKVRFQYNYSPQKTEGISAIKSIISLTNGYFKNDTYSGFYDQLTGCFLYFAQTSQAVIRNSKFIGGKSGYGGAIAIYSGSEVVIESQCVFYQNEAYYEGGDIYAQNYKSLVIRDSFFSKSYSVVSMASSSHRAYIFNNTFTGFQNPYILIKASANLLQFKNNTVQWVESYYQAVLCDHTVACLIEGNYFYQMAIKRVVTVGSTSLTPYARHSHQIINNKFANISARQYGGAIQVENINGDISGNQFINVSNFQFDNYGGAIFVLGKQFTDLYIDNNLFKECKSMMGGALAFDDARPQIGLQNIFINNYALISGNDLISYPQSLVLLSQQQFQSHMAKVSAFQSLESRYSLDTYDLSLMIAQQQDDFAYNYTRQLENYQRNLSQGITISSGGTIPTIYLALQDNYGEITHDFYYSYAKLQARMQTQSGSTFTGTLVDFTEPTVDFGLFQVKDVKVIAEPGTTLNITFFVFIDGAKALANAEVNYTISVKLNNCEAGEEFLATGECKVCPSNYYLLKAPAAITSCLSCPNNAHCFGGNKIGPKASYWRTSSSSINFIKCFNPSACLGSSDGASYDPKGTCASGYHGILCAQCNHNYVRNGSFQCAKCPPQWQNIFLVCLVAVLLVVFLVILIKITLKSMKERKSPFSAYFKILTNHLHLILLTASFELSWPKLVADYFKSAEPVANVSDRIISIDCFLDSSTYKTMPRPYLYLLIYILMPIFIVAVSLCIWSILLRRQKRVICNRTITTSIILLFLVHPSITTLLMRVFHCYKIDNEFRLIRDLEVKCYTSSHLAWALGGALPGIIVWGIGIPLGAFLFLYYSRTKLKEIDTKEKFGFLYNGYRDRHYYWESMIMFRKVAMIFITVFLSSLGRIVQALAVIILLINYLFFTIRKKPYQTRRLNELEITSLLTSSITIYCGVFFLSHRDSHDPTFTPNVDLTLSEETKWMLVGCILISNLIFFALWIFFFFKDVRFVMAKMAEKKPKLFLVFCLCCRRRKFKTGVLQVKREEQDIEVINEIQDLESDLQHLKYKYIHKRFFSNRWEFEDMFRQFTENLKQLDKKTIKEKEYREIHSLEESEERQKHRRHQKQEQESLSQKRIFVEDDEKMGVTEHLDHEAELNIDEIKTTPQY